MQLLEPESLAKPHQIADLGAVEYDWITQTRVYRRGVDIRCGATLFGTDTGTKTHSGNAVFSDDEDVD